MTMRMALFAPMILLAGIPAVLPAAEPAPPRPVTLRECVGMALMHNPDIRVQSVQKESSALGVPIENAAFLPRFTADAGFTENISPSTSSLQGAGKTESKTVTLDASASKFLATGGTVSLSFAGQRQDLSSGVSLLSPEYTTSLTLSATQPLLKNRGPEAALAPLLIARANAVASDGDFRSKVLDIVASTRSAFFTFAAASRAVEVRRAALDLAQRTLDQTNARIAAGVAAQIDRLPAEATVASGREALIAAETAARDAGDELKNTMGVQAANEWIADLIPIAPDDAVGPPDDTDTFEEAARRRPEVMAQALRIEGAKLGEAAARNRTRPVLDLTVSGGLTGLAGSPRKNPVLGGSGDRFEGNLGDSLQEMTSGRYYNWFVGLHTEIPWRFDRERAQYGQARLAKEQQHIQATALLDRIRTDVRKGRRDLESAIARIEASRVAVAAAEKSLEAEEKKLSLGRSTILDVLKLQQSLSEARLTLVQSQFDAYLAQTNLWRAVGSLLEKNRIVIP